MVYSEAVGLFGFLPQELSLLHGFFFALGSLAGMGVLVGVIASTVYPLVVPLKERNKMSKTKKKPTKKQSQLSDTRSEHSSYLSLENLYSFGRTKLQSSGW